MRTACFHLKPQRDSNSDLLFLRGMRCLYVTPLQGAGVFGHNFNFYVFIFCVWPKTSLFSQIFLITLFIDTENLRHRMYVAATTTDQVYSTFLKNGSCLIAAIVIIAVAMQCDQIERYFYIENKHIQIRTKL
jgi:hypothetical protein